MVADLNQHRDAFGIAGFCDRRLVSLGAEFPAVFATEYENHNSVRTVGVDLQFGPSHRDEFGFGLAGLAHVGCFLRTVLPASLPVWRASVEGMRVSRLPASGKGRRLRGL